MDKQKVYSHFFYSMEFFQLHLLELVLIASIGFLGLGVVLWGFPKVGLLDFPERYGIKRKPIPYPAGIMLVLAFLVSGFFFFPAELLWSLPFSGFLGSLLLLVIVSFWDDRVQLSPWLRLAVQVFCSALVIGTGTWIQFLTNPFSEFAFQLPFFLGALFTAIWILGFINATNWLDGVPNLTLSSGLVASVVLGFLSLSPQVSQPDLAFLCSTFALVLFPFLLGNIGKTRFILGDSGSMTIGFCLAVFSLFAGGKMATVLIVMSIPIFDSIFVFLARILQKKSPLKGGDKLHLHDTLMEKGWSNVQIFLLYFCTAVLLGVSVLFLETWGKIILIGCFGGTFFGVRWWMMRGKLKTIT